jgi:hypothetical protein
VKNLIDMIKPNLSDPIQVLFVFVGIPMVALLVIGIVIAASQ